MIKFSFTNTNLLCFRSFETLWWTRHWLTEKCHWSEKEQEGDWQRSFCDKLWKRQMHGRIHRGTEMKASRVLYVWIIRHRLGLILIITSFIFIVLNLNLLGYTRDLESPEKLRVWLYLVFVIFDLFFGFGMLLLTLHEFGAFWREARSKMFIILYASLSLI